MLLRVLTCHGQNQQVFTMCYHCNICNISFVLSIATFLLHGIVHRLDVRLPVLDRRSFRPVSQRHYKQRNQATTFVFLPFLRGKLFGRNCLARLQQVSILPVCTFKQPKGPRHMPHSTLVCMWHYVRTHVCIRRYLRATPNRTSLI